MSQQHTNPVAPVSAQATNTISTPATPTSVTPAAPTTPATPATPTPSTPATPAATPALPAGYPYAFQTPYTTHPAYSQTPGAHPYQSPASYGYQWNYPYYTPQASAPATQQRAVPVTPSPAASRPVIPAAATPRATTSTFSTYQPSQLRESVTAASTAGAAGRGPRKQASVRGTFTKELKNLMYGFGDDRNPANDTVNVMEEILLEYITDVCQTAGSQAKRVRLSIEDLRRALSRPPDAKKLARMEELLFMQEDIKRARAQFEENDVHNQRDF
ncbi:unnamed protein product [Mycena citricolor]|uniref:Transcription initiation factor TFIID subunit 13 n=1 Tax=Mycena citricolor TaxID=2018698 RepID=A0AAD2HPD1_9AGAR|nr:unnamed protein product [Mycena citricolor]